MNCRCGRSFTPNPLHHFIFCVCGMRWTRQEPGRKSHHATSARAPVVTFCMDDGCRYAAGHDGSHDITWQEEHDLQHNDGGRDG